MGALFWAALAGRARRHSQVAARAPALEFVADGEIRAPLCFGRTRR